MWLSERLENGFCTSINLLNHNLANIFFVPFLNRPCVAVNFKIDAKYGIIRYEFYFMDFIDV